MMRVVRICLIALPVLLTCAAAPAGAQTEAAPSSCRFGPSLLTAGSVARGTPNHGTLVRGVQFPPESAVAFTWDFPLGVSPSRPWRRWGTEKLVRTLECVLTRADLAHPFGQRVGVADLSRPNGGPFGSRYGGLGHASHQNGLDVDVVYPRIDQCECAPQRVADLDVGRSQELIDDFVAAGAKYVFVSPVLWRKGRLHGPQGVVRPLVQHDDHMHVRLRP